MTDITVCREVAEKVAQEITQSKFTQGLVEYFKRDIKSHGPQPKGGIPVDYEEHGGKVVINVSDAVYAALTAP